MTALPPPEPMVSADYSALMLCLALVVVLVVGVVAGSMRLSARERAEEAPEPAPRPVIADFADIAAQMPEMRETERRVTGLYLIPDDATKER